VHYEVEVILRINRVGKNIERKFAHRYYGDVGLGIDFTARDLQRECREKGLPWEMAKGFDGSAVIGNIVKKETFEDVYALDFSLWQNDKTVQTGNTKNLIFSFDEIIAYVSQFLTLKIGDLIFTGTPAGVGPVKIGDKLTGFIQDTQMFRCDVK
jgi:2-keto-4-pentenoate hydratase/2-oxohepta-3-ene-1,7-dioic acid hydratase in catechol pathway